MEYKRIIVILREETLEAAEELLRHLPVDGITLSHVKGWGEYKNMFTRDWLSERAKLEIFVPASQADAVIGGLAELCKGAPAGAGIAAVVPVERFVHLRCAFDRSAGAHSTQRSQLP